MVYLLQSDGGGQYRLSEESWKGLLDVARRYGWKPMGTKPNMDFLKKRARNPDGGYDNKIMREIIESWDGTYLTREYQTVTYADALGMAFSLEEALKKKDFQGTHWSKFISFCKKGSFKLI
jgi:hypothetical protein